MRPSQVLDVQAEMIDRTRDERYRDYMRRYLVDQYGVGLSKILEERLVPAVDRDFVAMTNINLLIDQTHQAVRAADAYWVSTDMMDLVNFANKSLDDFTRFGADVPPSPYGIVYLNKPLEFTELRGRTMKIHMMMWWPVSLKNDKRGIAFTGFTDMHDPDQITDLLVRDGIDIQTLGRWHLNHFDMWEVNSRVGPEFVPVDEATRSSSSLADSTQVIWPYSFNLPRWLTTYWTMMNQTVVVSSREPAERLTARRVRRYKIPEHVTVVQLRRRESDKEHVGETSVEWQHRWMVRGHWRNQPCGEGRHDVKRIWIHPFIKGPADKPLIQTEKVYALTR